MSVGTEATGVHDMIDSGYIYRESSHSLKHLGAPTF